VPQVRNFDELNTFDFSLQPSINEKLVRELMTGEYLDRKENILLVGNESWTEVLGCDLRNSEKTTIFAEIAWKCRSFSPPIHPPRFCSALYTSRVKTLP
jgi:hypothetical protein